MSFLNPLFLLAATAIAVPLALHLFHRQETRRVVFPALRYLLRTEKEHARRIRLRQLLLLLVRCAIILLLALAGARLVVSGRGAAHPPTAVVVILDNSLSSGRVLGEDRVLDRLQTAALDGLSAATSEDRVWVLRAGEPWDVAVPGTPDQARVRIRTTEMSAGRGDLSSALRRARQLVADADMAGGEIHIVSDLQASAFDAASDPAGETTDAADDPDIPVLVWAGLDAPDAPNRYLQEAAIGGGLPPLANNRTEIAVTLAGGDPEGDEVPVRLFIDDRVRGAAEVRPGGSTVLPVGPFSPGWVSGWVEADPDALRDDDRRWFAVPVRPPPTVALGGEGGPFVGSALDVLTDAGRAIRSGTGTADVVIAPGGAGFVTGTTARTVVIAPADAALLPAVNRRLADAGIDWRFEADEGSGEAGIAESQVPVDIESVRVRQRYRLTAPAGTPGQVLVRLSDGAPWIIALDDGRAPVLLIASPLDERASTLPVDAAMIPLVEWIVTGWGAGGGRPALRVGEALPLSSAVTEVETPDGERLPVDGSLELRTTRTAGIYRALRGDSLVELLAVNPPVRESLLTPLTDDAAEVLIGSDAEWVDDPGDWSGATFTRRQGYESWRVLLALALLLLLLESWIAASGGRQPRTATAPAPNPT
ncbi:BatA and WFA domain-containing protein [Gemmatimonadota bacterium DH-20]|uniref:BatA and WFA domain-containing protein n=1 Tax=Gaopeijia maritima TaxID=3119007 RepID=A0ABU9E7A0_9BACT